MPPPPFPAPPSAQTQFSEVDISQTANKNSLVVCFFFASSVGWGDKALYYYTSSLFLLDDVAREGIKNKQRGDGLTSRRLLEREREERERGERERRERGENGKTFLRTPVRMTQERYSTTQIAGFFAGSGSSSSFGPQRREREGEREGERGRRERGEMHEPQNVMRNGTRAQI